MKKILLISAALVFVGCSSTGKRGIASAESAVGCSLEKHPSKPHFKVVSNGEYLYPHWFDKAYATELLEKSIAKGKCN